KNPEGRERDAQAFGDALRAAAERAGFEVHGRRPAGSIGPPSSPEMPAASRGEITERTRHDRSSGTDEPLRTVSETLAAAPSPFGDEPSFAGISGAPSRRRRSGLRIVLAAFAIGA